MSDELRIKIMIEIVLLINENSVQHENAALSRLLRTLPLMNCISIEDADSRTAGCQY